MIDIMNSKASICRHAKISQVLFNCYVIKGKEIIFFEVILVMMDAYIEMLLTIKTSYGA